MSRTRAQDDVAPWSAGAGTARALPAAAVVRGTLAEAARPESAATSGRGRRSVTLAFAAQTCASGAAFATQVVLARALGLGPLGAFGLVWATLLFGLALQQALILSPLLTIGPKFTAETGAEDPGYYGFALRFQLGWSLAAFAVHAGGAQLYAYAWDEPLVARLALPLAAFAAVGSAQAFVRTVAFARERSGLAFRGDFCGTAAQVGLLVLLWKTHELDLPRALWAITCARLVAISFTWTALSPAHYERGTARAYFERHWRSGRWLGAKALVAWMASNSFLLAAGALLGTTAVGAFKAAQALIGLLNVPLLAVENVVPVGAARRLQSGGRAALDRYLRRAAGIGALVGLPVALLLGCVPQTVLELAYGSAHPDQVACLRWFLVLYAFVFGVSLLQIRFRTLESTRAIFLAHLISAAFALVGARPLVAALGIEGAVIGMALQQAVLAGLLIGSGRLSARGQRPA